MQNTPFRVSRNGAVMDNKAEYKRRVREAYVSLEDARAILPLKRWSVVIERSQLCVEKCAKAIISCFVEPEWTHDPSAELLKVVEKHKDEISKRDMLKKLKGLSEDTKTIAPWHVWSTYGKTEINKEGSRHFITTDEICTEEVACWALELAKRAYKTLDEFGKKWWS